MWNDLQFSHLYLECLKLGHTPILFKSGFNECYLYCSQCKKIYRIKMFHLWFVTEDKWNGTPLPKVVL